MSRISTPLCPVRIPVTVPAPVPASAALPSQGGSPDGDVAAPVVEPEEADPGAAVPEPPTVLLTGVSGVIGEALARALAGDFRVVALRGRRASAHAHEEVVADLAAPRLGLDSRVWAALAARADVVVHAAGRACYDDDADDFQRVNVSGSRRMAELAHDAGVPLIHVSTAFVDRIDQAREAAALLDGHDTARPIAYLESKIAAERAVAASGALACVVRPSLVMGDVDTGWTPQQQAVHAHIAMLLGGTNTSACAPHQRLDMVPRDVLAHAVTALAGLAVRDPERLPAVYWATAGTAALTCEEFTQHVVETARGRGLRLAAPQFHDAGKSRLTDYPDWEQLPARVRTGLTLQAAVAATLGAGEPFPTSMGTTKNELPYGPQALTQKDTLRNLAADVRFVMASTRRG
ncbi:SDR family oxidoreductase [Yinghuangia seranimata]|uniref:SDR family oxidoreductase n=1 Tax=Yinghuangia seranimata TaxID=408067 RepID=UPI00248C203A|nr:SDR family oxidoreductase [Yinghuangia seranimata]MDI2130718.1 SDR family oxidoreductase [Yinghuangia seranimata]